MLRSEPCGDEVIVTMPTRAAFRVRLRGVSEVYPRRLFAQFAFRVCLRGASETSRISEWRKRRQNAPLKWPPVQPIRIVLLIELPF